MSNLWFLMKNSSKTNLKRTYIINHQSCCTYIIRPNLIKLYLFANQLVLLWLTLIEIEVTIERKILFQWKTIVQSCGYWILVLFTVFEVLLSTSILNWIQKSTFLKYLAMALQTHISNFHPPFLLGIIKFKDCPWASLKRTR